jgi:hypothetical protein
MQHGSLARNMQVDMKLTGDDLKVDWGELSTLSQSVLQIKCMSDMQSAVMLKFWPRFGSVN